MFLYLSFINYFRHITFFTYGSFSIFVKTGCEKKEKISRRNSSVDTPADTATIRSSHRGCSVRKGVLRNLQNSQENTCAGLIPATLFKKRLWLRCFLVKFAKFLRTPFLQHISGRLLLTVDYGCVSLSSQSKKECYQSKKSNLLSFLFMLYSAVIKTGFMDKLFLLV